MSHPFAESLVPSVFFFNRYLLIFFLSFFFVIFVNYWLSISTSRKSFEILPTSAREETRVEISTRLPISRLSFVSCYLAEQFSILIYSVNNERAGRGFTPNVAPQLALIPTHLRPYYVTFIIYPLHVWFRCDNDNNEGEVGAGSGALNAHCPRYKMHRHPYYVMLLFIGNSRVFRENGKRHRSIPASNDDKEREFRLFSL